jgi:hypothetical protein
MERVPIMTNHRFLLISLTILLVFPVLTASATTSSSNKYSPVYAQQFKPTEKYARGTLQGDFIWAADSPSVRTARVRWKSFLRAYGERELDSAIQARLVKIAKYELMRSYYLLGDRKAADMLLRELDPLGLIKSNAQT